MKFKPRIAKIILYNKKWSLRTEWTLFGHHSNLHTQSHPSHSCWEQGSDVHCSKATIAPMIWMLCSYLRTLAPRTPRPVPPSSRPHYVQPLPVGVRSAFLPKSVPGPIHADSPCPSPDDLFCIWWCLALFNCVPLGLRERDDDILLC